MSLVKKKPLTTTEKCLLDVLNEPQFSVFEKAKLVDDYTLYISVYALFLFVDRIQFIELLKNHYN